MRRSTTWVCPSPGPLLGALRPPVHPRQTQGHDESVQDVGLRHDAFGEGVIVSAPPAAPTHHRRSRPVAPLGKPRRRARSATALGAEDIAPVATDDLAVNTVWWILLPVVLRQPQFQGGQRRDGTGQSDQPRLPPPVRQRWDRLSARPNSAPMACVASASPPTAGADPRAGSAP